MNRQEALEEFNEKVVKKLMNEYKVRFENGFNENEEKVKNKVMDGMKKVVGRAKNFQEINENYKIAVFQFELPRINVLNESYKIFAHGYNSLWYLDEDSICEEIDFKFLFEPFIELKEKLAKEKKIYIGKVNNYDVQKVIFDVVVDCYKSMAKSVRNWFWNMDEEKLMEESSIEKFYTIKWSEYQGKSETLFSMDNREKTMKELLELKKQPEEKMPFVFTVWKDSTLENGDLRKENMVFINFKGSKLENIDFTESDIVRGQYKNTHIRDCKFNNSRLIAASFENAVIKDSEFSGADCTGGDFRNTELSYVEFKDTNLKKAIFIDAKLKKVSFEGADVEEAVFSEKDIPFIHLSPEQLQTIYIHGGEEA